MIFSAIKDHAESTGHDAAKSDAVIGYSRKELQIIHKGFFSKRYIR